MVTSTSTPGSILMEVICLTISEGLCRSISRMWILIWNRSQVLEPSPQGVSLVVTLRVLVGIRTGPLALRFFSFAPLIRSAHTFSRDFTLCLMRVILIRWMATSGPTGVLPVSLKARAAARLPDRPVPRREWTAVSQEQKPAARSSASAATASSLKSCPKLFKLNADVSWLELIFIHYTGQLMKLNFLQLLETCYFLQFMFFFFFFFALFWFPIEKKF